MATQIGHLYRSNYYVLFVKEVSNLEIRVGSESGGECCYSRGGMPQYRYSLKSFADSSASATIDY
jgi:hypothetical protein